MHRLQGTERVHPERMRERAGEPQPFGGVGPCDTRLGPAVAEAWDYLVSCAAAGVLTSMDRVALQLAARLLATFWQSPAEFDPKYIMRLQALLGAFGMTPADRSKVVVKPDATQTNPFAKFGAK